jgi:hypothetical protein
MAIAVVPLLTIIVTWLVLGYNLFQLGSAFSWIESQIGRYRSFIKNERVAPAYLRKLNFYSAIVMAISYLVLLYFAGLAYWLLGCVLAKYLITALISDQMQARILGAKPFYPRHYWLIKVDALFNAVLLSFVLLVCVYP